MHMAIDLGPSPHHAWHETYCASCGVPESAGLGQHGSDCEIVYGNTDAQETTI